MAVHGQQNDFLQRLESVHLDDCGDVRAPFPAKLLQALKNLNSVEIRGCKSLEEVFELGEADEGSSEEEVLSSLTQLQLHRLPELKCIWKGPTVHVSLQNLARLYLWSLDKLTFIFTTSLARSLPKLESLYIRDCGELKHIIREEDGEREIIPESPCFPHLKTIDISGCNKLEYVFPVSLSHNRDGIIKFPQLKELSLQLRSNYSFLGPRNFDAQLPFQRLTIEDHEEVGNWLAQLQQNGFLQRLEYVHLDDCGDVRAPFPAKLLQALKNLKRVKIEDCKSLEEVFELGEADEGSSEEKELPLLSSLTELKLSELPELKCIWKGPTRNVSLQNLVDLEVSYLNKLTFIFAPSLAQGLPKLETLEIRDCGELKHIIREEDGEWEIIPESPRFPKLKKIFIEGCGKLEYVFTVSVSPSLPNLEEMTIDRADNLKQIFYSGEGDALPTYAIIKFPRLRELSLSSISNYSFFGPKNFAAQLPSLEYLKIDGHKELENLSAQLQGLTNLETLSLKSLPDMRCIWKGLVLSKLTTLEQNGFLQRLEFVQVDDCGDVRAPFPAKLLQALKNLKSVKIKDCKSLEEVFELGEADEGSSEEKELPLLSSLTELKLSKFSQLKCIWKGPTGHVSLQSLGFLKLGSLDKLTFIFTTSLAQSLPKLERLEIRDCGELKHIIREEDGEREIIQESPRFPKLKRIFIQGCGKLEYVFTVSVSPSLPNLEEMTIDCADNLKQIFYSGEGDALPTNGIIKFPQLRELSLSNGSFFGPKNFAAQLPSLQILEINGHKELGNLCAQLQGLANLENLRLESLPDMRCIWKGLVLSKLTTLEVVKCKRLTHVFTCSMIVSLVQLKVLKILSCEELEQIIARDNDDEKDQIFPGDHLQSLCFPNLCEIEIRECNKLKSLFPVAMASGLPKLQTLEVSEASQLLGVFGQEDHASPVNVEKEMVLPNLKELSLEQLSSIVCLSFGSCDFLFPCLKKLRVYECSKLTTKFASTPDGSMSAQSEVSEVSEVAGDSSINREWTRNNGWKEVEEEEDDDDDDC